MPGRFRMETVKYRWSAKNPLSGDAPKTWTEMLDAE